MTINIYIYYKIYTSLAKRSTYPKRVHKFRVLQFRSSKYALSRNHFCGIDLVKQYQYKRNTKSEKTRDTYNPIKYPGSLLSSSSRMVHIGIRFDLRVRLISTRTLYHLLQPSSIHLIRWSQRKEQVYGMVHGPQIFLKIQIGGSRASLSVLHAKNYINGDRLV